MKIFLFLVLIMPGHEPHQQIQEMASVEECLAVAALRLQLPAPSKGSIQASCIKADVGDGA